VGREGGCFTGQSPASPLPLEMDLQVNPTNEHAHHTRLQPHLTPIATYFWFTHTHTHAHTRTHTHTHVSSVPRRRLHAGGRDGGRVDLRPDLCTSKRRQGSENPLTVYCLCGVWYVVCGVLFVWCVVLAMCCVWALSTPKRERERERARARLLSIRRETHHHTRVHNDTH
jgi:hypothetical protein